MDATYRNEGQYMDYTPSGADVAAGDVVVVGDTVAVATEKIEDGDLGALVIRGVVRFPKATTSTSAIAQGTKVYWNAVSEVVTETAGANKVAGYTVVAATAAATTVDVSLARA
jgi:predicted RecA/RadA family phage recombinase